MLQETDTAQEQQNFFLVYQNTQKNFRTKSGDFCKKMKKTTRGIFPTLINAITSYSFENQAFYDNHVSIKKQEKTDYHGEAELKNMD